jgi:hypothetical protein
VIISQTSQQVIGFYVPWAAAAVAAPAFEAQIGPSQLILNFGGFEVPALRLTLAVIAVLLARVIAPRGPHEHAPTKSVAVTVVLVLIAASWVIESRPGLLFTFIVSMGLGFSGYTILELAGREIEAFVKRIFAAATGGIGSGKDK